MEIKPFNNPTRWCHHHCHFKHEETEIRSHVFMEWQGQHLNPDSLALEPGLITMTTTDAPGNELD